MSRTVLDVGLSALAFSRQALLGMFETIPPDKRCHQPIPGGNHALWVTGHLAQTDDFFLSAVAGQDLKLPEHYRTLFGMGSKPSPKPGDYPAVGEILGHLTERREALVRWLMGLSGVQLAEPLPGEFASFAPTRVDLPARIAWHEGVHSGQLTMIRKSLGMAPVFA